EEAAHGAQNLDEAVVEAEKDVAHSLGVDASVLLAGDEDVLVLEFVLQNLADRGAQRAVAVAPPYIEILLDAVDFDRLEHDVDRGGAEDPAHGDDEHEPQPAPHVQACDMLETEELLPERDVARLVGDQGLERAVQARRCDRQERPVEREVEDLVEDKAP